MERLYTIPEAAEALRVKRATVYKWIREGKIATVYAGDDLRITQSAIEAFIRESTSARRGGVAGDDRIVEPEQTYSASLAAA